MLLNHLSDRELALLGQPTRSEVLSLVGWMALANAFGPLCSDGPTDTREPLPSRTARYWIGGISQSARIKRVQLGKNTGQNVLANKRRKVRVRVGNGELATGRHW